MDEADTVEVLKVFDGDGFLARVWDPHRKEWAGRIPFRLAFIDAPEIEQPFGNEAMKFLSSLISGKELRLGLIGKESTGGIPIDQYKRVLCVAYLTEQLPAGRVDYYIDGKCGAGSIKAPRSIARNIELEMIVNGWAWVVRQYAFEQEQVYFEAEENARQNRRGLWIVDSPEPPWVFKRKQRQRRKRDHGQSNLF